MKITYNWLKDFVEIKIAPQELADKLTMAGLEVVSLEQKQGDFVFEIEITSNRPDWLSIYGVAREVAAITGKRLSVYPAGRLSGLRRQGAKAPRRLSIEIENNKDCPVYTARIMRDIKVGPSPGWLSSRLELVGCRSVNNIVDITNYLLFETGEPLHAFDLDKLSPGEIIVRRASPQEKIITIDGQERKLDAQILVIADKNKPLAIAGVMGGKESEVTQGTKNILLEAAVFNPLVVRRSRQRLGLLSESAYRFERGVDSCIVEQVSLRCSELIRKMAAGEEVLFKASGRVKTKGRKTCLHVSLPEKVLGERIPLTGCKNILMRLGFAVKQKGSNALEVNIPSFRQDVRTGVDLIEEIARIYGYGNIAPTLAALKPGVTVNNARDLVSIVKEALSGLGINEAITYSLVDRDSLQKYGADPAAAVTILNPLSREQEILRPTLIPSLLRCVAHNLNQKQGYVSLFETAKVFIPQENGPKEELALGLVLCGERNILLGQGALKDKVSLLHIKGCLEAVFNRLGIRDYSFRRGTNSPAVSVRIKGEELGYMLEADATLTGQFDIKNESVCFAQISLEKLFSQASLGRKYIPAPKYPGITRDISFVIAENVEAQELLEAIGSLGLPLRQVKITDYYRGRQIPVGMRGITVSCFYRLDERTLTEEEVNPVHQRAVAMLVESFAAQLR